MSEPARQEMLEKLASICELSPDVRFGQMLANLGFLAEDFSERSLWDIEDAELLRVMERHLADLSKRASKSA